MREGAAKGAARVRARRVPVMRVRLSPACPHCASPWTGVIKGESLKKEALTLRAAWKEDEKARREEHEADKTNPLRNHVLGRGFRSVVAKVLFELLQREAEARMNQVEQQAIFVSCQSGYSLSRCSDLSCETKTS